MAKSIHMAAPQPTPAQKALQRVIGLSKLNGWSVVVVAGLGGLIALAMGDWLSCGLGLLVGGFGAMEVKGNRLLRQRDAEGMKWLIRSQMLLLALILAYCASRLGSFDAENMMSNLTPDMEAALKEAGIARADIVPLVHRMFLALYLSVALASLLYQGGLALYYRGKTRLVAEALSGLPPALSALAAENDQRFYDAVAAELGVQNIKPGLWARALAEASGDEARTKARYIQLRVEEMKRAAGPGSG
jgi:hypothetical protein